MDKISEVVSITETPEKARSRYYETRYKETDMLEDLADFYSAMLRKGRGSRAELEETYTKMTGKKLERDWPKEIKTNGDNLMKILEEKYNLWQDFSDSRTGLNEGGNGEIFMRWVGHGLIEGEPELFTIKSDEKDPRGIHVEQTPKKDEDNGVFDVVIKVRNKENAFCRFRFNASFNTVNNRIVAVEKEIQKMRNAPDPFAV